jgi:hypothetical protein
MDIVAARKQVVEVIDDNDELSPPSREERDQERFYSLASHAADAEFWAIVDCWTVDEATALSKGRNPEQINWQLVYPYTEISQFAKEYQRRRRLFIRACKSGVLPKPIPPAKAIAWAKSKGIDFPIGLEQLVTETGPSGHVKGHRWTVAQREVLLRSHQQLKEQGAPNPTQILARKYGVSETVIKKQVSQQPEVAKPRTPKSNRSDGGNWEGLRNFKGSQ